MNELVVFKDRADAAFFYGETAALSIYGVVDASRTQVWIAPLLCIGNIVGLNTANTIAVNANEVEAA